MYFLSQSSRAWSPEPGCEHTFECRSRNMRSPAGASRTATDRGSDRRLSRRIPHHSPSVDGGRRMASSPPPSQPTPPSHEEPATTHLADSLGRPPEGATTTPAADPRRERGREGEGRCSAFAVAPSLSCPTASITSVVERTSSSEMSSQFSPHPLPRPLVGSSALRADVVDIISEPLTLVESTRQT